MRYKRREKNVRAIQHKPINPEVAEAQSEAEVVTVPVWLSQLVANERLIEVMRNGELTGEIRTDDKPQQVGNYGSWIVLDDDDVLTIMSNQNFVTTYELLSDDNPNR